MDTVEAEAAEIDCWLGDVSERPSGDVGRIDTSTSEGWLGLR